MEKETHFNCLRFNQRGTVLLGSTEKGYMIFDAENFELILDKNIESNIGAIDCIEQT